MKNDYLKVAADMSLEQLAEALAERDAKREEVTLLKTQVADLTSQNKTLQEQHDLAVSINAQWVAGQVN